LRTSFGAGLVDLIEARLKCVERLYNYVRVACQAHCQITHASVTRLVVQYHSGPSLSAELRFPDEMNTAVQLGLQASGDGQIAADMNPHRRMQPLLQVLLGSTGTSGAERGDIQEYGRF